MQKQTRETMRQNVDNPEDDGLNEMTEKNKFNFTKNQTNKISITKCQFSLNSPRSMIFLYQQKNRFPETGLDKFRIVEIKNLIYL